VVVTWFEVKRFFLVAGFFSGVRWVEVVVW